MTKSSQSKAPSSKAKTPAKKAAKPAVKAKAPTPAKKAPVKASGPTYAMPLEVKDWIERAQSTINHLRGEVERLKTENAELKAYKRFAEQRILRSDHE
jgi:hypothetical protein